ncbi:MAG: mechanosensitive ion channel family protein, partial [Lachnospiraceae bacterium]|nr:mechanosensitive ion channel family protein [Lachnospiraceae bacterium]
MNNTENGAPNAAPNGTPNAAQPAPKAHKLDKHNPWRKVIILAVILVLVLLITNPSLMFFLPASWREAMKNGYNSLFGDVDQIKRVLNIQWVRIFKVIVIVLFMMIVKLVLKIVMDKIKPKTPKGASIYSMVKSFSGYAIALILLIWCLSAIGVNLSTIFASIGIVALVIGFAAESLIEDVVTGLFLVFE